ncbi:MAG: peptidoglycan DD-metalloendopeptidase family protein [Bacteroidia bacterium]|nr:peptidoglycan DD-metalloendopeptidase family protein [Bacteroidia bacterium]
MDNLAWYLLSAGFALGLLLLPYKFAFSRLTHFKWNRAYLLAILGLSLLLPGLSKEFNFNRNSIAFSGFPQIQNQPKPTQNQPENANLKETNFSNQVSLISPTPEIQTQSVSETVTPGWLERIPARSILWSIYLLGLSFGLFRFCKGIFRVIRIYQASPAEKSGGFTQVFPAHSASSFSFFKWMFLSPADRNSPELPTIEAHELAHIRQWHSLDVVLVELACKIWWFLPWMPYLKNSLRDTHEYLADQEAAQTAGKSAYAKLVLAKSQARPVAFPLHFFAQSKTHKRIAMLHKNRSQNRAKLAYLTTIPLILLSLSLLAFLPAPSSPSAPISGSEWNAGELTFAGEALPDQAVYHAALQEKIARFKAKPDECIKLAFRAANRSQAIKEQLKLAGLPDDFLYLAMAESGLDPTAASPMGACGLWQFIPSTAQNYGMVVSDARDDRMDFQISTASAARYLLEQKATFGTWTAAALAFNRGPNAVKSGNPANTLEGCYALDHEQGYLYRILAMKQLVENPFSFGLKQAAAFQLPLAPADFKGVSSEFGPRKTPLDEALKNHNGVDFKAPLGTPVMAVADGTVEIAETSEQGMGNTIRIQHLSPLASQYNHLQDVRVKPGQQVRQGEVIGTVGNTGKSLGPHLHLEIRENDIPVNPNLYLSW